MNGVLSDIQQVIRLIRLAKKPIELRTHKTITNTECYRLIDADKKSFTNISKAVAQKLVKKNIIKSLPPLSLYTEQKLFDETKL